MNHQKIVYMHVIPAKAGIQCGASAPRILSEGLDTRLRGYDKAEEVE